MKMADAKLWCRLLYLKIDEERARDMKRTGAEILRVSA
jgi:hypothetical protein